MKFFDNSCRSIYLVCALGLLSFSAVSNAQVPLAPTVIFTTDAQTPANTGVADVDTGDTASDSDFYIRERRTASETDRRISTFLNFDVSSISSAEVNQPGFSVALTADYDFRLNNINSAPAVVGRVTNGAWNGTSTLPLHSWGIDDSADLATMIADVSGLNPPASVSADVTDIVKDWVEGTHANYGLAVFIDTLEFNGAGFSNPQLIVTLPLDTDGDGMPDNYEVANGLNPNFDDSGLDSDSNGGADGLTNLEEFNLGTDPQDSDTDDDGLSDGDEVNGTLNPWTAGVQTAPPGEPTDPFDADSDNDSVNDQAEILAGTNPNFADGIGQPVFPFIDTDGDSYRDEAEVAFGSDPNDPTSVPDFTPAQPKPNVVIIYADDMGLGDVSIYGNTFGTPSPATTPHMDALAAEGVMFTQAHSCNGACTQSRYGILTGKYHWREFNGISSHYGSHSGISDLPLPQDITIAESLKTQGYDTAAFGKWHLGGRWHSPTGTRVTSNPTSSLSVDWDRPVERHATGNGFDYFRGLAATINFGPYVYIHDDRPQWVSATDTDGVPTAFRDVTATDNMIWLSSATLNSSVIGAKDSRSSLGDPSYRQIDAGPVMVNDFQQYIADRQSASDADPFFAYVALYSPHKPWAITPAFETADHQQGFDYADFMREVDDRVGRVVDAIDNAGYGDNTIVILTSDNGPENTAMSQSLQFGKDPNGPLRGNKRDTWEGGTRVPFIVRWPGQAAVGLKVSNPIWQGDIFTTVAAFLHQELPDTTAPDGESFLNLIRGQKKPVGERPALVVSSIRGDLGLKTIDGWKLIDSNGGGHSTSWDADNMSISNAAGTDRGFPKQLFQLNVDLGETNNLIVSLNDATSIRNELSAVTGIDLLGQLDDLRTSESTSLFARVPDNDGDQMPNDFELANGLDPDWPLDAASDLDGDGVSNLDEFIGGTDPNDPNDPSFLLGDVNQDGAVTFLDIAPFIALLSTQDFQDEADIDRNGVFNFLDIDPFITLLSIQ